MHTIRAIGAFNKDNLAISRI